MNQNPMDRQYMRAGIVPIEPGATPRLSEENSKDGDVGGKLDAIEAMEDSDDPKSPAELIDAGIRTRLSGERSEGSI